MSNTFHAAPKSPAIALVDAMRQARDLNVGDGIVWRHDVAGRYSGVVFFCTGAGSIPRGFVTMVAGAHLHDEIREAAFALGEAFVRHGSRARYVVEQAALAG